jgi:hypothetical protein
VLRDAGDPSTSRFTSPTALADALRRAAAAPGEHEKRIGREDPSWPDWYARHIVQEQAGEPLPF